MPKKDMRDAPAEERIGKIIHELKKHYQPISGLTYSNPFELLIAVILSAQTRDERVNRVTPVLFAHYPDPWALAKADVEDVDQIIRTVNFHGTKARNIIATSQILAEQYNGVVPADMESLVAMPGVGRKTANVVMGTAYGLPAITVDTHFNRVSNRLHLTSSKNPDIIERDLVKLVPPEERIGFSHRMIWHGRKICTWRNPQCEICPINKYCPSAGKV